MTYVDIENRIAMLEHMLETNPLFQDQCSKLLDEIIHITANGFIHRLGSNQLRIWVKNQKNSKFIKDFPHIVADLIAKEIIYSSIDLQCNYSDSEIIKSLQLMSISKFTKYVIDCFVNYCDPTFPWACDHDFLRKFLYMNFSIDTD